MGTRSSFRQAMVAIAWSIAASGCGATAPSVAPTPKTTASSPPAASTPAIQPLACTEPAAGGRLDARAATRRHDAVDALLRGDARVAAHELAEVLIDHPNDVPSLVLREAAVRDLKALHAGDTRRYASIDPHLVTGDLEGPVVRRAIVVDAKTPPPSLSVVSVGPRAAARADADPDALLPADASGFATTLPRGDSPTRAFRHADHDILLFGDHALGITKTDRSRPILVELSRLVASGTATTSDPRHTIHAAQVVGRTLLVGLAPFAIAASQPATTGYVVAIDLDSSEIRWISAPRTSNAGSLIVTGAHVIAGFGERGGRGSLEVLDLATGAQTSRLELPHPPTLLEVEGDHIVVTSDEAPQEATIVAVTGGLSPAPSAALELDEVEPPPHARPGTACVLRRAMSALDARKDQLVAEELAPLDRDEGSYGEGLLAAARFVARADAGDPDVVDLSGAPLVVAAPPFFGPAQGSVARPERRADLRRAPRLTLRRTLRYGSDSGKKLIEARDGDIALDEPPGPPSLAPAAATPVTFAAPESYGVASLYNTYRRDDANLLVYGQRYVAVLAGHRTRAVLDLGAGSDGVGPLELALVGDTLFVGVVAEAPSTDARAGVESIAAYDVVTGRQRWRSDPHVSSAGFLAIGDHLVAARGYGQEKAWLSVVRTDTGEVVQRLAIPSAPRLLSLLPDAAGRADREVSVACATAVLAYDLSP